MSILGSLVGGVEAPFRWLGGTAKATIAHLIPPELEAQVGLFAHTFTASVVHDFGAEAKTLSSEAIHELWKVIEQTAATLGPQVLTGKVSFAAALATGVKALKSDEAAVMMPALKNVAETTISTWLPGLLTTSLAAAAANPPQASPSKVASS